MKGFFSRLVSTGSNSNVYTSENSSSSDVQDHGLSNDKSSNTKGQKVIVGKTKNDLERKNHANAMRADMIRSSAKTLSVVIGSIINDSSIVSSDNNEGFYRLISLLESNCDARDLDSSSYDNYSGGEGCLSVLIKYIDHESFSDIICEQRIAELLFGCMRLLRAFEMKQRKLHPVEKISSNGRGITYLSMSKIVTVLSKVIVDNKIAEQLRPLLVKLIVYPLSSLPETAIHLQTLSAEVITSLCKNSLPTSLIWYLHDQQLMVQITRNLNDLIDINGVAQVSDISLKGLDAEKFGMWEIALKCVVDVITASLSSTAILLTDLEQALGFKSIIYMIENSSIHRSMSMMNTAMRLMFDPNKASDEPMSFPSVGKIFIDILISTIGIKREISRDDSLDKIVLICQHLMNYASKILPREHILSSLAYSLLTVYSNDPRNCIILEETYHYLPTLVISIVALNSSDTISAILTTLNYVCQCVEIASTLPLVALCVVSFVLTQAAITNNSQSEYDNYMIKLDLVLSSIDAILRSNPKYALVFINIGLLNYLICKPFEDLHNAISTSIDFNSLNISVDVYNKLLTLLINLEKRSPYIADEIKNSGILLHVRALVLSPAISESFVTSLLSIFETIAQSQRQHLQDSIQSLLQLLNLLGNTNIKKAKCVIDSIYKIFFYNDESSIVWKDIKGREELVQWLDNLKDCFENSENTGTQIIPDKMINENEINKLDCLKSIIQLIEIDIKLSYPHLLDQTYNDINFYFNKFFQKFAFQLLSTGLFESKSHQYNGLRLLIHTITGSSKSTIIVNYEAIYICLYILPELKKELAVYLLNYYLLNMIKSQEESTMKLSECGVNRFIIENYYDKLPNSTNEMIKSLNEILLYNLTHYHSIEDFYYVLRYLVRPKIIPNQLLDDQKLFPCWVSYINSNLNEVLTTYELLKTIYLNRHINMKLVTAPHVTLGENIPIVRDDILRNGELNIPFNNLVNFPISNFSIVLWIQINIPEVISQGQSVNLMTLINNSSGKEECLMEIGLFLYQKEISIVSSSDKGLSVCKFSIPPIINIKNINSWFNICISYKKVKKISTAKSILSIYINGIQCEVIDTYGDQLFENEISQNVGLILGKSLLRSDLEAISYNLASLSIYEETLTANQIILIYVRGVEHKGVYHGTDFNESIPVLSSKYMMKYSELYLNAEIKDLKLLETICDPVHENIIEATAVIPYPLVVVNVECLKRVRFNYCNIIVSNQNENSDSFVDRELVRRGQMYLYNSSILYENPYQPISTLSLNSNISLSRSLGSSISSLGGPLQIFPLIQHACTEATLRISLELLLSVTRENDFNLKFMKRIGYKILSFVISLKPIQILNEKILNCLYDFAVIRTSSNVLLVDTSALHYLILNHQVWGIYRFNISYHVLTLFNSLVKDPTYGHLNSKRLAGIGLATWILNSCIVGVELSVTKPSSSKDTNKSLSSVGNLWDLQSQTDNSLSSNDDAKDPYLYMAMNVLLQVLGVDIKHKDLEIVGNIILYTFSPSLSYTSNLNNKDLGKSPNMPLGMVYSVEKKSLDKPITRPSSPLLSSNTLSLFAFFRVYLLRLIYALYEENHFDIRYNKSRYRSQSVENNNNITNSTSNTSDPNKSIHLFHLIFNVDWLLNIIDISSDISTRSTTLRLLALFIQTNPKYYKEILSKNKFKMFENLFLYHSSNELSLVLPLITLTFNIPIQVLPYPIQVNSPSKVLNLVDLDDCPGPKCSEQDVLSFTLPLLSILFDFLISNSKTIQKLQDDDNVQMNLSIRSDTSDAMSKEMLINEIILGMILKYFHKDVSFRQIFQRRNAIDLLSSALLSCSNALDDFGTKIFSPMNSSIDTNDNNNNNNDIAANIKDDYLNLSKFGTIDEIDSYRTIENDDNSIISGSKQIGELTLNEEGLKVLSLIQSVIYAGFKDFENQIIVCHFALSFPSNMDESFIGSFQYNIFQQAKIAMNLLLNNSFSFKLLTLISQNITYLISIARARVLHEFVQFELLQYLCELINKYKDKFQKNDKKDNKLNLLKDLIMSARYFASILLYIATSDLGITSSGGESFCLCVLLFIRKNFLTFLSASLEDSYDISNISNLKINKPANLDDVVVNMPIVDMFLITYSNDSYKKLSELLYISSLERLKISSIFLLMIFTSCYNLILHDNKILMLESLRLIIIATINRMTVIKQILTQEINFVGNRQRLSSEESFLSSFKFFDDGIIRLLPPNSSLREYESFLLGDSDNNEDEEKRISDFCYWFTERIEYCNKYVKIIDDNIKNFIPLNYDTSAIIRQIQQQRLKDNTRDLTSANGVILMTELNGYRNGTINDRLISKITANIRKFKIRGMNSLAIGSISWRNNHEMLQSSQIWGYDMINKNFSEERSNLLKCKFANFKGCKLDPTEGPEGMRRKIDQDYKTFINPYYHGSLEYEIFPEKNSISDTSGDTKTVSDLSNTLVSPSSISKTLNVTGTYEGFNKALSNLGSILRWGSSTSNSNMENLAKEIAKQGIKKIDSSNSYDDAETTGLTSLYNTNIASSSDHHSSTSSTLEFGSMEALESDESIPLSYQNDGLPITYNYDDNNEDDGITGTQSPPEIISVLDSIKELAIDIEIPKLLATSSETKNTLVDNKNYSNSSKVTKSLINEEILKGIIGSQQWNRCHVYNIERIFGLEASSGLLIITSDHLFMIGGFNLISSDHIVKGSGKGNRAHTNSIQQTGTREFTWLLDENKSQDILEIDAISSWIKNIWKSLLIQDNSFYKMALNDIYSVFKRRHHLKYSGIEITDKEGYSILVSCESVEECNNILSRFFQRELPPIIFRHVTGFSNIQSFLGVPNVYKSLMSQYLSNLTKLWQIGEISNFEYLMKLNSAAGRSFQDLTQYPVFPWILADYTSKQLDLDDPLIYRDLSKPMGALGYKRSLQFKERFRTMAEFRKDGVDNSPPPFHYGTHFSCAGYVLYYLIRLQPYSNYAITLQGGQFDISDRLFLSIESSWRSASQENLQDVRELIPEFFYLPEFLTNLNEFDLGKTQKGDKVNNVELPVWANNDPREFIRIHREALESRYVSENLHNWIDLIFGYKQRDEESMNVFIHLTYDGEVDVDDISDPILKVATISQINEFGQTPTMLFSKPHPKKIVPEIFRKVNEVVTIDISALNWHAHVSPPLCINGASQLILLNRVFYSQVIPSSNHKEVSNAIVSMNITNNKVIGVTRDCLLIPPSCKKYIRYGSSCGGIIVLSHIPVIQRDLERDYQNIENLHERPITCAVFTKDGHYLLTGSLDTSVRFWRFYFVNNNRCELEHIFTFSGHKSKILCVDIDMKMSIIVSGSSDQTAAIWDSRTGRLRCLLSSHDGSVKSVSINSINGNIITLTSSEIRLYSINGDLLCNERFSNHLNEISQMSDGCIALAPPCPEWQDGVVAVTGHEDGNIYLWKIRTEIISNDDINSVKRSLFVAFSPTKTHRAAITSLSLVNSTNHSIRIKDLVDRSFDDAGSLDLLVGDSEGYASRWSVQRLDQLPQSDLQSLASAK